MKKTNMLIASAFTLALVSNVASAATELLTNGSFATLTNGSGQLGFNTNATGWTATGTANTGGIGYAFVFTPGVADTTTGAAGESGRLAIWGAGNGSSNGFDGTSPTGGNIVALDSDYGNTAISQQVSGLTAGATYGLTFDWAASQQYGYTGDTVQAVAATLGGTTIDTASVSLPSKGFSGWIHESIVFTATASSELLTLNGVGNLPVPPFALLSDVSLTAVPEPEMVSMFGIGLLAMFAVSRKKNALAA
jgi:hypothetical protein